MGTGLGVAAAVVVLLSVAVVLYMRRQNRKLKGLLSGSGMDPRLQHGKGRPSAYAYRHQSSRASDSLPAAQRTITVNLPHPQVCRLHAPVGKACGPYIFH